MLDLTKLEAGCFVRRAVNYGGTHGFTSGKLYKVLKAEADGRKGDGERYKAGDLYVVTDYGASYVVDGVVASCWELVQEKKPEKTLVTAAELREVWCAEKEFEICLSALNKELCEAAKNGHSAEWSGFMSEATYHKLSSMLESSGFSVDVRSYSAQSRRGKFKLSWKAQ